MDKLMENHWFLKGISLLLALMLYMSTNLSDKNTTVNKGASPFPTGDVTETVSNIVVAVNYDEDRYIVSGIPKYVKVKLVGPKNVITAAKSQREFGVSLDLRGYSTGTYDVPLKYTGMENNLKATVQPEKVKVTIQNKVKKSFPVEVKYSNENQMPGGSMGANPTIKPGTVEVTGTKEELAKVALVRAYIDLKGITKTVTKTAEIVLYDEDGRKLDLQTTPSKVNVTIPVSNPTVTNNIEKTVPLNYVKKGSVPEGLTVTNISVEPNEVTISGPKDVLDNIKSLEGVEVDLSKITESTTFDASVLLPKGVTNVSPGQVKVSVEVQKQQKTKQKTIDGISIQTNGLSDELTLQLLSPQNGKISVDISGEASIVDKITAAQITASINLQNISPGTHDIPIQVSGPNNVSIEAKQKNAKVTLVKKEKPDQEVQGKPEQPDSQKDKETEAEKPTEEDQNKEPEKESEVENPEGTQEQTETQKQTEQEKGANSNG
ncbi:CdaR family protein [Bacillus bingmayongensis]|uniref:CdaR family protein n=1 Tax=Bacillus bingmayongensis TaxID=1150157 RepID=UPI0002D5A0FE|nr:CdaR family protein [Bacillus bingmayongensis]MBY0596498.1 YbbR-like domain-containing protein [Bacillus bingmayongensis]